MQGFQNFVTHYNCLRNFKNPDVCLPESIKSEWRQKPGINSFSRYPGDSNMHELEKFKLQKNTKDRGEIVAAGFRRRTAVLCLG